MSTGILGISTPASTATIMANTSTKYGFLNDVFIIICPLDVFEKGIGNGQ
jgi:hypothetical protein